MPSLLLLLDKAIKVVVAAVVKGHTIKVTNGLLQEERERENGKGARCSDRHDDDHCS